MTEVLDWNIEADAQNIRPGSIELQRAVHREWHDKIKSRPPEGWMKSKPYWRVKVIEKLEIRLGRQISGEVLEIGAGSALCSAFAAKRESVSRVTAMDYDRFCVEEMMPTVFEKFEAPAAKLRRALGSYNRIPERDFYDLIIGVGALHHAEDLGTAFQSLYFALKPGGIVLISDVCEPDGVTIRELAERYESIDPAGESRYGREVRLKDNGDHWYRFSEWLTASRSAGFEVLPYLFDKERGEPADDTIFSVPKVWSGHQIRVFQPFFSDRGYCDALMLVLQKPMPDGSTPAIPDFAELNVAPGQPAQVADAKGAGEAAATAADDVRQLKERVAYLKQALNRSEAKLQTARRDRFGSSRVAALLRRLLGRG